MGKSWGDDKLRLLNGIAEEHAIAAHDDEALDTYETEARVIIDSLPIELYDQDLEEIDKVTVLPSHCGLCGYKFERPSWGTDGSKCPMCGATTRIAP